MYCSASFTYIHTFIILFDLVQMVFSILHGANAWYYCMRRSCVSHVDVDTWLTRFTRKFFIFDDDW